jgi:hypothetical protein
MEFALLLWLLCGIAAAMIGAKKGAGCLGFILGVILGPFGILFALVMKGNRRVCPHCKELIHQEATTCPHCQRDLSVTPVDKEAVTQDAVVVVEEKEPVNLGKWGIAIIIGVIAVFLISWIASTLINKNLQDGGVPVSGKEALAKKERADQEFFTRQQNYNKISLSQHIYLPKSAFESGLFKEAKNHLILMPVNSREWMREGQQLMDKIREIEQRAPTK